MIKKSINITILILILTCSGLGQNGFIEDGWKGIKLFKTDMATVVKILGEPKASKGNAYNYETDEFFAQVRYSTASCEIDRYGGKYNVPLDTAISYDVILNNPIKLTDFKFKREKYKRQPDSERNGLIYYNNSEDGILITVGVIDGIEYVGRILFYPSPADEKKFECKKPEAAKEMPQEPKTVENQNCKKP